MKRREHENEEEGYETNEPKISCYNNLCRAMLNLQASFMTVHHARGEWRRKNTRGNNMVANHVFHTTCTRISLVPGLL